MSETFPLEVVNMAYTGYGVGRHEGKAIFIPYAVPGDTITATITQDKGRYAFARPMQVNQPSAERVAPRCEHFGVCGGCQWQMADYTSQLAYKQRIVADQFARIGGLPDAPVHPTLPSPRPYGYRSHVTFNVDSRGRLAYIQDDDRTPLAINVCHIIRPELLDLFESLKRHDFRGVERVRLQVGSASADRLVALTPIKRGARLNLPNVDAAISILEGDHAKAVRGTGVVTYTIRDKDFRVTAGSFFQVNLEQAAVLVDLVMERINAMGRSTHALDLYSGVGLFTAFLADHAEQVTAVELYAPAVKDARYNLRDQPHIGLIIGAMETVLPKLDVPIDVAVIDPPRAGMEAKALDALIRLNPPRIVYVSCDPSTLGRDAKRLIAGGWRLTNAQPVDMFPQTFHIETVATFER